MDECNLFDTDAPTIPGTGNLNQSYYMIFSDVGAGDYRPSPTSGARGAAEPSLQLEVVEDFAGSSRPQPTGTNADIGAFEVP